MSKKKQYFVFDAETFYDFFCAVFKPLGGDRNSHIVFEISEFKDDSVELYNFIKSHKRWKSKMIGYNTLGFDAQIIESFMESGASLKANDMYNLAQDIIVKEKPPHNVWDLKWTDNLDILKMWGYGRGPKSTSLKWIEFTLRMKRLQDLPVDFRKPVKSRAIGDKINKYCCYDTDATEEFLDASRGLIKRRRGIGKANNGEFYNMADQHIGEDLMLKAMSKRLDVDVWALRKKRTYHSEINIKDVILPYVKFKSKEFNEVLSFFNNTTVYADATNAVILKNKISTSTNYGGCKIDYGAGGIHASKTGIFRADENNIIIDVDVASYYPNLAINNEFYPEHLGKEFCLEYRNKYIERKSYPKSNPMNAAIKLMLNSAFGKSKSIHSFLFDVKGMFLPITINGQLLLSMLAEAVVDRGFELLQINTDGLTVRCDKNKKEELKYICKKWEELTKLTLEFAEYDLMVLENVNNYLATYTGSDKIKRKGRFETYEDIIGGENYYKNTSATIIAKAISDYFTKDIPIEKTINEEEDIYEFLYGVKKKSNFAFVLAKADDKGLVNTKILKDRVLRFYMATDGSSLLKIWNDFRITSINKEGLVNPLMYVRSPKAGRYSNLDRTWYINKAYEIIESVQGSEII